MGGARLHRASVGRPPRVARRATAGFLLTETLATFTISAFVLLGLVSAASVLLRAVDGSVARIERVDDLGRAMETIRQDIAGIARARWNGNEPQAFVFRGGPNSLYFAQAVNAPDGSRRHEAVALREIKADGRPVLVRSTARLAARAASFDDLAFEHQHEVWTGAARLRFSYVPRREGAAEPMPQTSWPIGTKLPAAILVEALDRDTHRTLVATRVTIEANADIGCLDDKATPPPGAAAQAQAPDAASASAGAAPPQPTVPTPTSAQTQDAPSDAFCAIAEDAQEKAPPKAAPAQQGPQL